MRLTVTTFLTIDGVMQGPGGPEEDRDGGFGLGGWLVPYVDDDFGRFIDGIFGEVDAFLLGRRTYQIFAGYWPAAGDSDPVARALNGLPKHVASRTSPELTWQGSALLEGDLAGAVQQLKDQPGKELQVHGSANLVQTLAAHDLVDTYRLLVAPVVLGAGKRLFEGGAAPRAFTLADHSVTGSGLQLLTYERAGAVETGTVGS
jgi:dihydrofolate reductase